MPLEFAGPATKLAETDIAAAATSVGLAYPHVKAVCDVESSKSGFLPDGRPKILCEAHAFHTETGGRYDRSHPNISSPVWDRALYAKTTEAEYLRLAQMIALDRLAGLKSASWGLFQIMGSNYAACGFASVEAFVAAMCSSELAQLQAFIAFITHEHMLPALKARDWRTFARRYNGPAFAANAYDSKLASAYARAAAGPIPKMPSATTVVDAAQPTSIV